MVDVTVDYCSEVSLLFLISLSWLVIMLFISSSACNTYTSPKNLYGYTYTSATAYEQHCGTWLDALAIRPNSSKFHKQ